MSPCSYMGRAMSWGSCRIPGLGSTSPRQISGRVSVTFRRIFCWIPESGFLPGERLAADANQAWTLEQALEALPRLRRRARPRFSVGAEMASATMTAEISFRHSDGTLARSASAIMKR